MSNSCSFEIAYGPSTNPTVVVSNSETKPEAETGLAWQRNPSVRFGPGLSKENISKANGEESNKTPLFAKLQQATYGKTSPNIAEQANGASATTDTCS
jgi:hypothetical protein